MTTAEKLEALVRRAKWSALGDPDEIQFDDAADSELTTWDGLTINAGPSLWVNRKKWTWQQVIYCHNFARALFGEEINDDHYRYTGEELSMREFHLQVAVISKDPIDYMYKAVFGKM